MSGAPACHCDESTRSPQFRDWIIITYRANYSAFSGYHRTPSDYSEVKCNKCGAIWRTKASYVAVLKMREGA